MSVTGSCSRSHRNPCTLDREPRGMWGSGGPASRDMIALRRCRFWLSRGPEEKMLQRGCGDQNLDGDFGWKTWLLLMEEYLVLTCTCVCCGLTWRFHISPGDLFRDLNPRMC